MMYLESTCYHVPAARCAVETVGAAHFLFGTDAPADERKVYCDDARCLLKI